MVQKKLNHYLNYKLTLYREVNKNIRYYTLKLYPTLFGEFLLIKEFGGVKNKKPTGIIKEYFSHIEECKNALDLLLYEKIKKGYAKRNINKERQIWTEI
jgi:predicted DNA-binding WGR domain protein